jgi:hypothetical protein
VLVLAIDGEGNLVLWRGWRWRERDGVGADGRKSRAIVMMELVD